VGMISSATWVDIGEVLDEVLDEVGDLGQDGAVGAGSAHEDR
jgi:hypothetical protein